MSRYTLTTRSIVKLWMVSTVIKDVNFEPQYHNFGLSWVSRPNVCARFRSWSQSMVSASIAVSRIYTIAVALLHAGDVDRDVELRTMWMMKERVLATRRPHPLHTLVRRLDEHGCRTVVHHSPHLGVGRQRRLLETTHASASSSSSSTIRQESTVVFPLPSIR